MSAFLGAEESFFMSPVSFFMSLVFGAIVSDCVAFGLALAGESFEGADFSAGAIFSAGAACDGGELGAGAAPPGLVRLIAAIPRRATSQSPGIAKRRTVARIEATMLRLDIRFVVTSLDVGSAEWIYDSLYCARGQAENLIKLHKTQLASDRTSCRSALANQVRLVLHTAAYWLMLTVRDAIPEARELATAEFATLRLRLLKIAAWVVETTSRIRLAFAAACPESRPDPQLARRAAAARSLTGGACTPIRPTHPSSALQSTGRQAVKSRRQSCSPRLKRCADASIGPKTALSRIGRVSPRWHVTDASRSLMPGIGLSWLLSRTSRHRASSRLESSPSPANQQRPAWRKPTPSLRRRQRICNRLNMPHGGRNARL